jgi:hypothetical protein
MAYGKSTKKLGAYSGKKKPMSQPEAKTSKKK